MAKPRELQALLVDHTEVGLAVLQDWYADHKMADHTKEVVRVRRLVQLVNAARRMTLPNKARLTDASDTYLANGVERPGKSKASIRLRRGHLNRKSMWWVTLNYSAWHAFNAIYHGYQWHEVGELKGTWLCQTDSESSIVKGCWWLYRRLRYQQENRRCSIIAGAYVEREEAFSRALLHGIGLLVGLLDDEDTIQTFCGVNPC